MNYLKFTKEKLSADKISDLVASSSCGAISMFIGTTRDNFEGKSVVTLEYEAYESMGMKSLEEICSDIRKTWKTVENIAIYHRLGLVPVKEASIVIAICSPHREDAIKATEWCIDNVKKSVPIWKKEIYSDSEATWKENKESESNPPKSKKPKLDMEQKVDVPYVPPYLIQIKATNDQLNERINKFMERKRAEIDSNNIREFCCGERDPDFTCARADASLQKARDCKSHLQVNRVLNSYQRDHFNSNYLKKYIPPNGIDERLGNLECQLSLTTAVPKNVYKRLKSLEDRLLYLETVSPEYIQFWDKSCSATKSAKKKVFSLEEIDDLISKAEKKIS